MRRDRSRRVVVEVINLKAAESRFEDSNKLESILRVCENEMDRSKSEYSIQQLTLQVDNLTFLDRRTRGALQNFISSSLTLPLDISNVESGLHQKIKTLATEKGALRPKLDDAQLQLDQSRQAASAEHSRLSPDFIKEIKHELRQNLSEILNSIAASAVLPAQKDWQYFISYARPDEASRWLHGTY